MLMQYHICIYKCINMLWYLYFYNVCMYAYKNGWVQEMYIQRLINAGYNKIINKKAVTRQWLSTGRLTGHGTHYVLLSH